MEHGVTTATWLVLAAMIVCAKLGGELALRLRQPAVLGELLAGVVLGNLAPSLATEASGVAIGFAAELGVMLLLFQVGLESSVREMVRVAPRAGAVAVLGVIVPSVLGFGASALLLPDAPFVVHVFIGATMCATSVGITARVLEEIGVLASEEAKIILGAAVIDDVLGLVVLAIVMAVASSGDAAPPSLGMIARTSATAIAFVVGALVIGLYAFRGAYRVAAHLRAPHVLGALSIAACLVLAGASAAAGLAAIVGAYAAGLLLDDVSVKPFSDAKKSGVSKVEAFVSPIVAVFAPVFFVRTGMSVTVHGLDGASLLLALVLVVTAILGKIVAGFGAPGKTTDRLLIGLGMTPRGEVGLIFADAGAHLAPGGKPIFSPGIHAALVIAVFATTLFAPPALAARLRKRNPGGVVRVE